MKIKSTENGTSIILACTPGEHRKLISGLCALDSGYGGRLESLGELVRTLIEGADAMEDGSIRVKIGNKAFYPTMNVLIHALVALDETAGAMAEARDELGLLRKTHSELVSAYGRLARQVEVYRGMGEME